MAVLYRKIGAALLVVVLLAIHGLKLVHTHEHHFSCKQNSHLLASQDIVDRQTDAHECAICQFHYTKDTVLPEVLGMPLLLAVIGVITCEELADDFPGGNTSHFYRRGPPAFVSFFV